MKHYPFVKIYLTEFYEEANEHTTAEEKWTWLMSILKAWRHGDVEKMPVWMRESYEDLQVKSDKAKESALLRWAQKPKQIEFVEVKNNENECERMRMHTERNANAMQIREDKIREDINTNTEIQFNTCDKPKKEKTTALKFLKPTQNQIETFCLEHSLNVDAVHFFNYYEANGWKVGKNAMKSWGATLRYWSRQNELKTNARAVSEPRKNKMQEMEDWNMKILKEIEDEFNAKYPK